MRKKALPVFCLVIAFVVLATACAVAGVSTSHKVVRNDDEVTTKLTPASSNALFTDRAKYTFEVNNNTATDQEGTVSYLVKRFGKSIHTESVKVHIAKRSTEKYKFEMPALGAGFYKVDFMINVTEYDDTTRRAFGIRPQEVTSVYQRPADFDAFWDKAKAELSKVAPDFKVTPMPKMSTPNRKTFAIEMRSIDNMLIKGWMTLPVSKDKNRKFPVLLGLPGYQVDLLPIMGMDEDLAIITLNVRGQGNSRGRINTRREEYIVYRIDDKNKYVMRGVIMDCIRCIDFICSRPELKSDNIAVSGGSMGGYLALATAGIDKRVTLCSVQNPILCDIRNLDGEATWPINDIKKYVRTQPGLTLDKVYKELDYFDGKNFALSIKASTLMGIGLLDPYAPPANEFVTFNNLTGKKKILVFKDLGHETSQVFKDLDGRWMRDAFALF